MKNISHDAGNHRLDIQVLRGLAVTFVILFHAKLNVPLSGFLGVDIFFVISGYLITSQISKGIQLGKFSLKEFYFRRMKRLLPAAYATFLLTWLCSFYFLTPSDLKSLEHQLLGAISFVSNIVLWKQSGYFSSAAELKPLLHTWSLAVEEQYYLFIPIFLYITPRRFWLPALGLAVVASFGLAVWFSGKEFTFYLLPFRAWEMLIGSMAALAPASLTQWTRHQSTQAVAFACLLSLAFAPPWGAHPGLATLSVCMATAIVILGEANTWHANVVSRSIGRIGDFSYSLYLAHWPIFAFANNVWQPESPMPLALRLALIALSFLVGYLLYIGVERPFHQRLVIPRKTMVGGLLACTASFVCVISWQLTMPAQSTPETLARLPNVGLSKECDQQGNQFTLRAACQTSPKADTLVWGDSFAMHLVEGLTKAKNLDIIQATKVVCGPLMGLSVLREQNYRDQGWARSCIDFNHSVMSWLEKTPSIKTVILASPFDQFVAPGEENLYQRPDGSGFERVPATVDRAFLALKKTIDGLEKLNMRVIIVAPPPFTNFDIGRCIERVSSTYPVSGVSADCSFTVQEYHEKRAEVLSLIARAERETSAKVVRFDQTLCTHDTCHVRLGAIPMYKDKGHFSIDGSIAALNHVNF